MTFSENKQVELSIVIAAWNDISYLRDCLLSLEKQIENTEIEVIVVSNFETEFAESEKRFPFVNHIFLSAEATVPKLRALGIAQSKGKFVALTEDFCTFDPNWCQEIIKAHKSAYAVIGGAIENRNWRKALDWAVYFFDYGKYMPPVQFGISDTLSGANISYKREILEQIRDNYEAVFFETFVHGELLARGYKLYLIPSAIIYHNKTYNLKRIASQFYHQARSFAAKRVSGLSLSKRMLFTSASLILPIFLPFRTVMRTLRKGRRFKELLMSLPYIIILMCIWSFGELCGYLSGEGKSDQEWR